MTTHDAPDFDGHAAQRSTYTWYDASRDIALTTTLKVEEAQDLTRPLMSLHPYDNLVAVKRLVDAIDEGSAAKLGASIALLLHQAQADALAGAAGLLREHNQADEAVIGWLNDRADVIRDGAVITMPWQVALSEPGSVDH